MRLEDVERLRREAAKGQANSKWSGDGLGVALDKNSRPPRLFGMTELPLDSVSDVRALYAALATRNTAGTLMNDSSSRSHCFAFLTLRAYDATDDAIRTSRFQFVDLAGSERLRDAHGNDAKWSEVGEAMKGLVTNYSLMQARAPQAAHTPSFLPARQSPVLASARHMHERPFPPTRPWQLSACARRLVEEQRKNGAKNFSFKAFIVDLVPLLQESMSGEALTACFVCMSQAPDNVMQVRVHTHARHRSPPTAPCPSDSPLPSSPYAPTRCGRPPTRLAVQDRARLWRGLREAKPEATAAGRSGEAREARRGGEQPQQGGDERAPRRGRRRAVQDDAHRAGGGFEAAARDPRPIWERSAVLKVMLRTNGL